MGKMVVIAILIGLLTVLMGCGAAETGNWEYVEDGQEQVFSAAPKYDISLAVPGDMQQVEVFSGEDHQFYAQEAGDFTLTTQILKAESMDQLLKEVTGQRAENLTVITTWQDGMPRHDVSWVSAGEEGLEVCRGVVMDDGSHYYTVIAAAQEMRAEAYSQQITDCLSGVLLTENASVVVTAP